MDDLTYSGPVLDQALTELEIINRLLGGNLVTINGLKKILINHNHTSTLNLADLGCGSGDMLRLIEAWGLKRNIRFQLTGIDANPNVIHFARHQFPQHSFHQLDIFSAEFRQMQFDLINCTLFLHHFTRDQLIGLLRQFKDQTSIGFIINDLHRHWFAYHSIRLITKALSRSPMVKMDAPISVLRGFLKSELEELLLEAGIQNYRLHWKWAFRWQLIVWS